MNDSEKPEPDPTGDPGSGFSCAREIAGQPALMGHSLPVARDRKRAKIAKARKIQPRLLDSTAYDGYHINAFVFAWRRMLPRSVRIAKEIRRRFGIPPPEYQKHCRRAKGKRTVFLTVYERITTTYRETVETAFPIPYHIAVERRSSDED